MLFFAGKELVVIPVTLLVGPCVVGAEVVNIVFEKMRLVLVHGDLQAHLHRVRLGSQARASKESC